MLARKIRILLLGLVAALVGACSAPCGAPGRLCAPIVSVTSAPPPAAQTYAVAMPGAAGEESEPSAAVQPTAGQPVRIALLLPLRSEALGQAADALRAGFLTAWERDRDGFAVTVVETGDAAQDVLSSYAASLEQQDIVVGPLARSAVTAVAGSALVNKPTIALNHPDGRSETALPEKMLVMGLSIEDEARQAARWAAQEHPGATALILSGNAAWQRRIASAFSSQWQRQGQPAQTQEMSAINGYLSDPELVALRARLQTAGPTVLFAALDTDQARQLRVALSAPPLGEIPIYGTSSLNPGRSRLLPGPELDGVRLLDLPWQLQRDHPAVMVYPQPVPRDDARLSADMERLYALGIDAFRVAREIALRPGARFTLDGVTGQLSVSFGQGAAYFERTELPAVYRNGIPVPLSTQP
ncbi:penicillin-binding protein activator [Massilia sp. BJB1822]|nr:penicillin-binding protein activator [Massilia sp. BJB1822]